MTKSWNRNFIFFHKLRWDICDVWNILVSAKCKSHTIYKMVERLYGSKSQWKYLTLFLFIDQPKKPRLMKLYCNCSSNIFTKGLKEKKLHYFFSLHSFEFIRRKLYLRVFKPWLLATYGNDDTTNFHLNFTSSFRTPAQL